MERPKRKSPMWVASAWLLAGVVGLGLMLGGLSGCAAMNYPKYASAKKDVVVAREASRQALVAGLAAVVSNPQATPAERAQAQMALLVMALTEKPDGLEAPREGAVERGFERLLDLAGLAAMVDRVGARVQGNSQSSQDRHDVTGSYNNDRHDSVSNSGQ